MKYLRSFLFIFCLMLFGGNKVLADLAEITPTLIPDGPTSIAVGETTTLIANNSTIYSNEATWDFSSSDESVVSIEVTDKDSNGMSYANKRIVKVTALKAGTATITWNSGSGNYSSTITVVSSESEKVNPSTGTATYIIVGIVALASIVLAIVYVNKKM